MNLYVQFFGKILKFVSREGLLLVLFFYGRGMGGPSKSWGIRFSVLFNIPPKLFACDTPKIS